MEHVTSKELHMWFESMQELKDELPKMLERNASNKSLHARWPWRRTVQPQAFYDTNSVEEAFNNCERGWPKLLKKIEPMVKSLRESLELSDVMAVQIASRRRKRTRSDYGDTLDMHKVWSGQLDRAWERPIRVARLTPTQRYASVFVDLGMNFGQHTDQSLWRAALSVCLADTLTRMGINTEVWSGGTGVGAYHEFGAPYRHFNGVRIKAYTQPLNEERMAAMCHAAFFRTWGFSMIMASSFTTDQAVGRSVDSGDFVLPLRERKERGERVFRISQVYYEDHARQELHRIISELKNSPNPSEEAA